MHGFEKFQESLMMLKSLKFVALAAALLMGTNAQAGPITGSQGFAVNGTITTTPDALFVATATQFDLTDVGTTGSQTGDFIGYPNTNIGNVSLMVASLATFNFGNVDFGTFQASSGFENPTVDPNTRAFRFLGTFSPGTNAMFSTFDPTGNVGVLLNFNQSGGQGSAIAVSYTLDTNPTFAAVPEPGSLAIALSGLGLGLFFNRRRLFAKKI